MIRLTTADLRKLRGSLLAAAAMAAVGAVVLISAHTAKERREHERWAILSERSEADAKLKRVRDEENEIRLNSTMFNRLLERGIIGEEQRLDWVELLEVIREQRRLLDLQYEIAPQRQLEGGSRGEFTFFASAMKLQLKLLHEEDLTRLLEDLRQRAKAMLLIRRCTVSRLPASSDERTSGRANLLAECEIDWLTVRETARKP